MTYDDFNTWLDAVQTLSPAPVVANDRWHDAFLCVLDPHVAVRLIQPERQRRAPPGHAVTQFPAES
jgi:hypothetical protein